MKSSTTGHSDSLHNQDNNDRIPIFGYELLRDILIPDLLGQDSPEISYWAGKHLARKFPLLSMDEIYSFFSEASWGELTLLDETKKEIKLQLSGAVLKRRFLTQPTPCFRLEAGFLAQQIQFKKKLVTEAHAELDKKKNKAIITVRWDLKDPVD